MPRLTLVPAYGRDYKSKAAVLADWDANKDFEAVGFGGGGKVNKEDCPAGNHNIRYAKQTKVLVVTKALVIRVPADVSVAEIVDLIGDQIVG